MLQLKSKVHEWRLTKKEGKSERETCGNWSWKMRAARVMQEEDVWGGGGGVQSKISRRGGRSNGVGWTLGKRR